MVTEKYGEHNFIDQSETYFKNFKQPLFMKCIFLKSQYNYAKDVVVCRDMHD